MLLNIEEAFEKSVFCKIVGVLIWTLAIGAKS
jgi:hypothetical protein